MSLWVPTWVRVGKSCRRMSIVLLLRSVIFPLSSDRDKMSNSYCTRVERKNVNIVLTITKWLRRKTSPIDQPPKLKVVEKRICREMRGLCVLQIFFYTYCLIAGMRWRHHLQHRVAYVTFPNIASSHMATQDCIALSQSAASDNNL